MNKQTIEAYAKIRDALAMAAKAFDDILNSEQPTYQKPVLPTQPSEAKTGVQRGAVAQFPQHLQQFLTANGNRIEQSQFVSRENWLEINAAAKELGYRYVSKDDGGPYWELT